MDLTVTLQGNGNKLVLKNPVIAASGTFGNGLEFMPFGDIKKLGGIATKGLSILPRPGNPMPRIAETPAGMLNSIGLQNEGVNIFLNKILPQLPSDDTAIITNVYAASIDEFGELCATLDDITGIAALELNISCPNVKAGGAIFGSSPQYCYDVTSSARKAAPHKFLIVKLSPNVTDIAAIAKSAEDAGANCISCINTLLGMGINAATRRPLLANIVGGLSGPAIKPVALRCVWQVSQAVKIPVIGIGGITTTVDILEFLLAGASAVQIGTANFMRPDTVFTLADELPKTILDHGGHSINDFIGGLLAD